MEWLKSSILTMDNKHVPSDQAEIKKSLQDIKKFRLEEYALRLKEKKNLTRLSEELTNILDSNSENIENETRSVEKVWMKFDSYIQLRESLLEKTLKKFEEINKLGSKLDKLIAKSEKRVEQIKQDLDELASKTGSMSAMQVRSYSERFTEHFLHCDKDLEKMSTECEHLNGQDHPEAISYQKKIRVLQSRHESFKEKVAKELESKVNKPVDSNNNNVMSESSSVELLNDYLAWIKQKNEFGTRLIQKS